MLDPRTVPVLRYEGVVELGYDIYEYESDENAWDRSSRIRRGRSQSLRRQGSRPLDVAINWAKHTRLFARCVAATANDS